MANIVLMLGVREVLTNMKLRKEQVASGAARGLKKAGLHLQRASQLVVPVEFGALKASAYTRSSGLGFSTEVFVGYTASYALFVHESVGMVLKGQPRTPSPPHQGQYWDPQGRGQAKFLEEPARRLTKDMRRIVEDEARIK